MRSRVVPLLSLLGLLAGLLVATPATAADPPTQRTVTLQAPDRVRVAKPTTLTAHVTDGTTALAGQQVRFEVRSGTTWRVLATRTTDASGDAGHDVPTPYGAATYRAVLPASGALPQVVSGPRTVTGFRVHSQVSMSAWRWTVVDETARWINVRFVGDGQPVNGRVTLQSRVGKAKWRSIKTGLTGADGQIAFQVRPRVDTFYRAVGHTGQWWWSDYSATRWLNNLPPAKPVAYPKAAPRPRYLAPNARASGAGARPVVSGIPDGVWRSMVGRSWHRGCPVGRSSLRLIRINYWGYDGYRYRGELVVNAAIARKTVGALKDMYAGRYPIRRMHRVDRFGWSKRLGGADDYASMARGNTSAFNCRGVVGNPSVRSPHSYGRAIDINTWENPYVSRQGIVPNTWWHYRSHPRIAWRSGSHPVMKIWRSNGFRWTYGNSDAHHYDGRQTAPQWPTMVG